MLYAQSKPIEELIEDLRKEFKMDMLQFTMNVSMFLSGNHNRKKTSGTYLQVDRGKATSN